MTGYESKRAAAQDKLVVTDIDGHVVRDARKPKKAQPAQEPVAWAVVGDGKFGNYELGQVFVDYEATHIYWKNRGYELVPVYTTPPQRPWVSLTPQDLNEIFAIARTGEHAVRLALDKIKEKNNG